MPFQVQKARLVGNSMSKLEYNTGENSNYLKDKIKELQDELKEIKYENLSLKKTLQEYGIIEISQISDVEYICNTQIDKIKALASDNELQKDQVENLEKIVKVLNREWAGIKKKELKTHENDVDKLLKIVNSDNE